MNHFTLHKPCFLFPPFVWKVVNDRLMGIVCVSVLSLVLTPHFVCAQNAPHPSFRQYTTNHGLASSEVYQILQDDEGYIWASTDNGVSRFDGYAFRNYGLKDGLRENVIFRMQLDDLGRVWMQAQSGNLYYFERDSIHPYWNNKVLLSYRDRLDTRGGFIVEGNGDTIHMAILNYGVITIFNNGKTQTYASSIPISWQILEKDQIVITAYREQGHVPTIQSFSKRLLSQNRIPTVQFQSDNEVWSIPDLKYTKNEGQAPEAFWLGKRMYLFKAYQDLWLVENGKIKWTAYFPHHIDHVALMKTGQLYIGLYYKEGVRVYESLEHFLGNKGYQWLSGHSVSHFIEDRDGGKWFSTNEDGLYYAAPGAFLVHDTETGIPDEKVTAVSIIDNNELYAGLGNGEVWRFNSNRGKWEATSKIPSSGFIRDLYYDPINRQLWAGRLNLYYLENKDWKVSSTKLKGRTLSMSNRITGSPDGKRMWTCNHLGFMNLDWSQNTFPNIDIHTNQRTYIVREDQQGRIWVGQPGGLFEWKNDSLHGCQHIHPSFSLRVEDLAILPDTTLVVATKGGGIVLWKGQLMEEITSEHGLVADMLECIFVDEQGVIWAGTLNGLCRISGSWENWEVQPITVAHGLPSNEINSIRVFRDNVWVATNKGLVQFSDKKTNHFSPKPIIHAVLVNNLPKDFRKPLLLKAKQNNLNIQFSAINHKMNGLIPYRYRMDRGEWRTLTERSLQFPALSPGERLFEVQAQNEDGIWSESTSLSIEILPHWWNSWWASLLLVVTLILTGIGVFKFRTRQLKKAHQIQLKIAELERAALQAQMNPHFIFNCLNSIQNYILQNKKEAAILYLGSFASLVRSMLNASVAGKVLLSEEIQLLNNYLKLEQMRFKDRFSFEVKSADELNIYEVKIPPLLVQPYVENAIIHGISGKDQDGRIEIFFSKKDKFIEVSIFDNGTGFKERKTENFGNRKSFGMSITKNRLDLLSEEKKSNLVKTKTLRNENGQVLGAQVRILIGIG